MNIILGFGSTEQEFEQQEKNFVYDFLKEKSAKVNRWDFIFSDEVVAELKNELEKRYNHYMSLNEKYDTGEKPERYSYFYYDILWNVCKLVVVFDFSHINTRHPLSPDGMAMMQNKGVCGYYNYEDFRWFGIDEITK